MNDIPRQHLCDILTLYGENAYKDKQGFATLLDDLCGQYTREISAIMVAVAQNVPDDLIASRSRLINDGLIEKLTQRLVDRAEMGVDAAEWSVQSWAQCLHIKVTPNVTLNLPGQPSSRLLGRSLPSNKIAAGTLEFFRPIIEQSRLAWSLMSDPRVSLLKKMIPILGVAYIISPIGLIVDLIPIAGLLANAAIFMLALILFNSSVAEPIREDQIERLRELYGGFGKQKNTPLVQDDPKNSSRKLEG